MATAYDTWLEGDNGINDRGAAIAELIEAAAQYRREFGWRGTATQERSARRIGAALARVQGDAA